MHMDHTVVVVVVVGGRGLLAVDGGGNALSCLRHLSSCIHSRVRILFCLYTCMHYSVCNVYTVYTSVKS